MPNYPGESNYGVYCSHTAAPADNLNCGLGVLEASLRLNML